MLYPLAKWLFPKLRPDESRKRLNLIIIVTLFTVATAGLVVAVMWTTYSHIGR